MTNAGSPGSTSTTANTTMVASSSVTSAAASRRERNSSILVVSTGASRSEAKRRDLVPHWRDPSATLRFARGDGLRPSLPIHARQIDLRRLRVLPQADEVLLPYADLGELEQEAVHRVNRDDALGLLQKLVALLEVGGGEDLAPLGLERRRIVAPVVAIAGIAIEVVGLGVSDD